MSKNELISCFEDTLKWSECQLYSESCRAIKSNKVYKEGFLSTKRSNYEKMDIIVEENTSFAAAKEYSCFGRTAVLNFANPVNPAGGVQYGAMAQEESLCRSSNLFLCLTDKNVYHDFYQYHRNMKNYIYSDRIIYTKGITVFKDDSRVPQLMSEKDRFFVDVLTCAAPCLTKLKYINQTALFEIFEDRIRNIFEVAIENQVEVLILGAFGCGAFKNPPDIVAKAFRQVLLQYEKAFRKVIFAIKKSASYCPNLIAFGNVFSDTDRLYEWEDEGTQLLDMKSEMVLPSELNLEKSTKFKTWRRFVNPYYEKKFSILGDSISTLEGYNPRGNKVYYKEEVCEKTGISEMMDTWWGQVIDFLGGELLVNDSWSGSRVTRISSDTDNLLYKETLFPSGCSDERTSHLHLHTVQPDVIIVYLGTNDWIFGAMSTGYEQSMEENEKYQYFDYAYQKMIQKLKQQYPNSEIWCCTLSKTVILNSPSFKFPDVYAGSHIETYNNIIRYASSKYNCRLVDLYERKLAYDSLDGTHPTKQGMNTLAIAILREIVGAEAECFIDCKNESHTYEVVENYTGGTKYVCSKCGKMENIDTFKEMLEHGTDSRKTKFLGTSTLDLVDKVKTGNLNEDFEKKVDESKDKRLKIGDVVSGRYKILNAIGTGGYSVVYLVIDEKSDMLYAMKAYDKDAYSGHLNDVMKREVQMMMKLRHPVVPYIIDMIEDEANLCIIEEYIQGKNLKEMVSQSGPLAVADVINIGYQLSDFLSYLHTLTPPHIYRDMKPDNVVLMTSGHVKVIDYGTMRLYKPFKNSDTTILGTPGYAPPEQYGIAQTDARSDIFSLGMTLYYLMTGMEPYKANNMPILPISVIKPELPKGLEYIITKCTQSAPADRYQSCKELIEDLRNYQNLPPKKKGFLGKILKR